MTISMNAPCPCGSNKKFKQCCGRSKGSTPSMEEQQQMVGLFRAGLFPELEQRARALVSRFPGHGPSWNFLGVARLAQKLDAFDALERAASLLPGDATAQNNFGNALKDRGDLQAAAQCFARAVSLKPDHARAHLNLGAVLKDMGRLNESVECSRRALALNPDYPEALANLGMALSLLGRPAEAEPVFRRALVLQPDYPEAMMNLGVSLSLLGRSTEAARLLTQALRHNAESVAALIGLGITLCDMGDMEGAEEALRKALQLKPESVEARSALLFVLNYQLGKPKSLLLDEARAYGEVVAGMARPFSRWLNVFDPERRLRVGFVSGDFCQHPVAQFLEHVVEALVDGQGERLEMLAYHTRHYTDAFTERLRGHFSVWRHVAGMGDEALAEQIYADQVDILIDLSGHTAHSRLPVFAWRPAPLQMTWLGYLATTGVAEVDFLLADSRVLPESLEGEFTEKIVRMPQSYLCFTHPGQTLAVSPLPAGAEGRVTFGSFNNLRKLNDTVLDLWARILNCVPQSRLLLKASPLADAAVQARITAFFASRGIPSERLILMGHVARDEHLATYAQVDIALDPFPYPGITTSVEALWMGVPVLSLAGRSFMGRQGLGLLTHLGLEDWVASDAEDYLARAVRFAGDRAALANLRATLRDRLEASPIFDREVFATDFEAVLRQIWRARCAAAVRPAA